MPRDSSGNYTLPAGNPVADSTVISSTWANPTMGDIANEITQSLDRNGRGGMLVPFRNVDGTVSAPGITFTAEPSTGLYRALTNDVRMSIGNDDTTRWIDANSQPVGEQSPFQIWDGQAWAVPLVDGSSPTFKDTVIEEGFGLVVGHTDPISIDGGLAKFSIVGTDSPSAQMAISRFSDVQSPLIVFMKSKDPSIGGHKTVEPGDGVGAIYWYADDGTTYDTVVARFRAVVDPSGVVSTGVIPGTMALSVADSLGVLRDILVLDSNQTATFSGDLTVSAGDLTLVEGSAFINCGTADNPLQIISTDANVAITLADSVGSSKITNAGGALVLYSGGDAGSGTAASSVAALTLSTGQVATFAGASNFAGLMTNNTGAGNSGFAMISTDAAIFGVWADDGASVRIEQNGSTLRFYTGGDPGSASAAGSSQAMSISNTTQLVTMMAGLTVSAGNFTVTSGSITTNIGTIRTDNGIIQASNDGGTTRSYMDYSGYRSNRSLSYLHNAHAAGTWDIWAELGTLIGKSGTDVAYFNSATQSTTLYGALFLNGDFTLADASAFINCGTADYPLRIISTDANVSVTLADSVGSSRVTNASGALVLYSGGDAASGTALNAVAALTLSTGQDATFAGNLTVTGLSGSGTRNVVVDASGVMSAP